MEKYITTFARSWTIAGNARRFRLLARRLNQTRSERKAQALDNESPLALYDVALVAGASELDKLCAQAVETIAAGGQGIGRVLDLLSVLEGDRIVAMYLALEERRHVVLHNPTWARYVHDADLAEIAEAAADIGDHDVPMTPLGRALARAYTAENDAELADALMGLRAEEARFTLAHGIEGSSNGWQ
jgi:hypothetical protein